MIEEVVPKYSMLRLLIISKDMTPEFIYTFMKMYKKKPLLVKKETDDVIIKFTEESEVTLKPGSILFFDGARFNYVFAEDADTFREFFFNVADLHTIDVCRSVEDGYQCKNCGAIYKEPFADECPNCGIDRSKLNYKIKKAVSVNSKIVSDGKKKRKIATEKYVCPSCNFIANEPFEVCPNCQESSETCKPLVFTDITHKLKGRMKMCKETNNVQEVEEQEETKVTAVYGDSVFVPNTAVQANPSTESMNNDETSSNI